MERSLFSFIWTYSKREQLVLLAVTVSLFPLLFLTLELPKRIINDAIDADSSSVPVWGIEVPQVTYLFILCGFFLLAVVAHGLMKMRINTMKGSLSETLLRRFRFSLIARILRFPTPYFERTSQGELVSMVTSEAEPMGGLMGDAIAQPVLQAGQMLTILGFLFAQSPVFGVAACALIPLQGWLIPKLQRRINLVNKKRVVEVRALASEIGETAAGAVTLRLHGGWRYRLAMVSKRLAKLYVLRLEIFKRKFFMKFLTNFISQLTPLFFYAIGGYLAIKGEIAIGTLVAALAAFKELSAPWKELLAYYNQYQDLSLRWEMITERFAPPQILDAALFEGDVAEIPSLAGDIELNQISVRSEDGKTILDNITAHFGVGQRVAISAASAEERAALCAILTREVLPASGTVEVAGHALSELHQSVVADRIGHATAVPVLFTGSFAENLFMPLMQRQVTVHEDEDSLQAPQESEAAAWLNVSGPVWSSQDALHGWWLELIQALRCDDALFRLGLDMPLDPETQPGLAHQILGQHPALKQAIAQAGLDRHLWPIDGDAYNPALPVIENLLFARQRTALTVSLLAEQSEFLRLLSELDLEDTLLKLSTDVLEMISQIFGIDGSKHPLFRRLGLEAKDYETALALAANRGVDKVLSPLQKAQLLIVSFSISSEVIGPSFPPEFTARVLEWRKTHGAKFRASMPDIFEPILPDAPITGLSVMENAMRGKIAQEAGRNGDALRQLAAKTLSEAGLQEPVLGLVLETPVGLGSKTLPVQITEPLSVCRAAIKCPDVLVLDSVMGSHDADARHSIYESLAHLLPKTTLICLEASLEGAKGFDTHLTLHQGRISKGELEVEPHEESGLSNDQTAKIRVLNQSNLFAALDPKQQRLLAFGSYWHQAEANEYLFRKDEDPSSGAYLIFEGSADLLQPAVDGEDTVVAQVGPGDLVGELGLIRNEPRALDMRAATELKSLRIGSEAFLAVVENDAATAFKLLQVVSGYVGK